MRTPDSLLSLVDHGIIDEVVRPLMSGKEAQVYLVVSGGEQRVAKIYKEAQNRSFQNRADYTEGRKVRNSRDQRAMGRGSRHGRAQNEAAWRSAEVDMIYRLRDAGVRVPNPHHFIDGVLIMELVTDADGFPAPRLGDLMWEPADAAALFQQLLGEVVRMLSIGVVHGDLSDFNVLMGATGPVIIDFPQSIDASTNANARKLLLRDVDNLHRFAAKFAPDHVALPYAQEMWELYKRNALTPETRLSGRFKSAQKAANTGAVLDLIADANKDERRRREALGLSMRGVEREPGAEASVPQTSERPAQARDRGPERASREVAGAGAVRPGERPTQGRERPRGDASSGAARRAERPGQGFERATERPLGGGTPRVERPGQGLARGAERAVGAQGGGAPRRFERPGSGFERGAERQADASGGSARRIERPGQGGERGAQQRQPEPSAGSARRVERPGPGFERGAERQADPQGGSLRRGERPGSGFERGEERQVDAGGGSARRGERPLHPRERDPRAVEASGSSERGAERPAHAHHRSADREPAAEASSARRDSRAGQVREGGGAPPQGARPHGQQAQGRAGERRATSFGERVPYRGRRERGDAQNAGDAPQPGSAPRGGSSTPAFRRRG